MNKILLGRIIKPALIIVLVMFVPMIFFQFINYTFNPKAGVKDTDTTAIIHNEILTYKSIDSVLNLFEATVYEDLTTKELSFLGYDTYKYADHMKGLTFYKIYNKDTHIPLIGHYNVGQFLPDDTILYKGTNMNDSTFFRYLCIDKKILYRFLDLILMLRENGYSDSFIIKDGYRYPSFNKHTGGAPYSRHIYGHAIDLYVGDINADGTIDINSDKKIVLDMLENHIIADSGGVGRYPWSTVVHFDTRGYKARWDKQ